MTPGYVVCVDTGSTFTKAAAVAVTPGDAGRLLATASVPTTVGPGLDVLTGLDDAVGRVVAEAGGEPLDVRACSSAGGGLRLAVVGYERVVTAEAGARVGLSAGAKVVHVSSGPLDRPAVADLATSRPDVVLLVGGTDGGDAEVLLHNAHRLSVSGPRVPYVVAGNADAREHVVAELERRRRTVVACPNVLPRIGVLDPLPARAAIRDVFVRHVIGGKGLTRGPRFARLVRGATPDLVLAGIELLADHVDGDVLLVDVGGATTDVYSALTPDAEESSLHREVVEVLWRGRTVEGDLGMRWGATGVVGAALAERLVAPGPAYDALARAADVRHEQPGWLPSTDADRDEDAELARLALTVALRRHARPAETAEGRTPGRDLSRVSLVVASGGVFRHADPALLVRMLAPVTTDHAGGWRVPASPRVTVDRRYVIAAAGLLAPDHPAAAAALLHDALDDVV
ncbi:MAG: glutamate mutase [Frankiales bacterium]|nr:glutamate mutase [Frankiales bacterium]